MAKAIKFNIIINKKHIRDIDDLRENFNIHDILQNFNDGILERWLRVRKMDSEIEALQSIKDEDNIEKAKHLCTIFNRDLSDDQIEDAVCALSYYKKVDEELKKFEKVSFEFNTVIKEYHDSYEKLCQEIEDKPEDYGYIKNAVNVLWDRYRRLHAIDFVVFVKKFSKISPLVLFSILANSKFRKSEIIDEGYKQECFRLLFDHFPRTNNIFDRFLTYPYRYFSGVTDGYWKDIESKEKKYMILFMENGNFVRSAGKTGEEYGSDDVNAKFPILDGIDYKSNDSEHKLIYLEV